MSTSASNIDERRSMKTPPTFTSECEMPLAELLLAGAKLLLLLASAVPAGPAPISKSAADLTPISKSVASGSGGAHSSPGWHPRWEATLCRVSA